MSRAKQKLLKLGLKIKIRREGIGKLDFVKVEIPTREHGAAVRMVDQATALGETAAVQSLPQLLDYEKAT